MHEEHVDLLLYHEYLLFFDGVHLRTVPEGIVWTVCGSVGSDRVVVLLIYKAGRKAGIHH